MHDGEALRALQAPLKEHYRKSPEAALITLKAAGRLGEGVTCKVDTGKMLVQAGLHPLRPPATLQREKQILCDREKGHQQFPDLRAR